MAHGATRLAVFVLAATAVTGLVNTQPAHADLTLPHPVQRTLATSGDAWWGIDTVDNVQTGNLIAQTTSEHR